MESTKQKKILTAVLITVIVLAIVGGLAAGIYCGVNNDRYSGYVYDIDTNKPLAGIAVTNGRDVVKTDENGAFKLDGWMKQRFITLTIPSGYWTENYYIEIGKESKGYDFYLKKKDVDETSHKFLQVTDTEINTSDESETKFEWTDEIKNTAEKEDVSFIIHTGDICYVDGLKNHISIMNTENMGVPVRYIIGNHDYVKWGKYSEDLFESTYGPVNYSFDVGDIHYVVTAITKGDYPARYGRSDVWRWLANDLEQVDESKKVVIFNHDYCPDENGFVVKYGVNKLDIKSKGLIAWVFGHWHYSYLNDIDGILNITTSKTDGGGIDSTPACTRLFEMQGNAIENTHLIYRHFDGGVPSDGAEWFTKVDGHGEFAEPIYANGNLYVATVDDGYPKNSAITCLNPQNGDVKWKYATKNSIRNSFAVDGDSLVAQDVEGRVYRIDANTGKEIWVKETNLLAAANTGLNVLVEDGRVYCGGAQKSVCLRLEDGSVIWEKKNARANSSPTRMVIDGDRLIVGSHWDELIAYNKYNGKRIWDNDKGGLRYRTTTPTIYEGKMYVAAQTLLFELDRETGKILRSKDVGMNMDTATAPYIVNGIGYFATAKDGVVAFDMATFEKKYEFKTGTSLIYTSPYTSGDVSTVESSIVPYGDNLVFGASDGYIYMTDRSLNVIAKYKVFSPVLSKITIVDGYAYALDFSGYVTKVKLENFMVSSN